MRGRPIGRRALKKCEALGVKAVCVQADVSTDAECKKLVDETVAALGGLDILVNNAGFTKYIDFGTYAVQESDWHELMSANVYGNSTSAGPRCPS